MNTEFRNKPLPSDWILPERVRENMDDLAVAVLSEHDIEGVPIPFGFQFTFETGEVIRKLDDDEIDARLVIEEIKQKFAEVEERYPDAPMWDRLRGHFVDVFLEKGHEDEAIDLMWTIKSPRDFAAKLMDFSEATEGERIDDVFQQIMAVESPRQVEIIRAFRDRIIDNNPFSDVLWIYNDYLLRAGVEKDSIDGWAESQSATSPQYDWKEIAMTIKDEPLWEGVPTPLRQHLMLVIIDLSKEAAEDVPEVWGADAKEYLDSLEDRYPSATMWSHFRGNLSLVLLEHGSTSQALVLATSIRNSGLMTRVALEFIERKHETEAIELAVANPDHKSTADILLDAEWKGDDEAPVRKLEDIIVSDDYPFEKRLICLEAVRDRFFEAGHIDLAAKYQERIDDLKEVNP